MYIKKIKILIINGFHIRPIVKVVKLSKKFKSNISIINKKYRVNPKNIFQLQKLSIIYGDIIVILAEGIDEYEAVNELIKLISNIL